MFFEVCVEESLLLHVALLHIAMWYITEGANSLVRFSPKPEYQHRIRNWTFGNMKLLCLFFLENINIHRIITCYLLYVLFSFKDTERLLELKGQFVVLL